MNNWKQIAMVWHERGYCVLPILPGQKKPWVPWKELQTRKSTKDEIEKWWTQNPQSEVAVMGGHDGLVCCDVDDKELAQKIVRTFEPFGRIDFNKNSGKAHLFMREEEPGKSGPLIDGKLDLKGQGAIFRVAPSGGYAKLNDIDEPMPIPAYPTAREYLGNLLRSWGHEIKEPKKHKVSISTRKEGEGRNNLITSISGLLRHYGAEQDVLQDIAYILNKKYCDPPLEEKEVDTIIGSISRYEPTKPLN